MSRPDPQLPDGASLGSDPFSAGDGTLPFLIRLRERSIRPVDDAGVPRPRHEPRRDGSRPDLGPPIPEVGSFEDPDELDGWLDRLATVLLGREEEERIARIAASYDYKPYDPLGLSTKTVRRTLALFKLLYRYYFRVESSGHEACEVSILPS